MSAAHVSTLDATQPRFQFSIRSLLWLMLVVALALACLAQTLKLHRMEQALARHAWAGSDIFIPAGKFRLLVNRIIDDKDLKVCIIRFEANEEHFVTADGAGSITTDDDDGGSHWAEIKIVANYDETVQRFTLLTRVGSASGWAGGKSVYTLPPEADPEKFVAITVEPGLYDLTQPIELGHADGEAMTLSVR